VARKSLDFLDLRSFEHAQAVALTLTFLVSCSLSSRSRIWAWRWAPSICSDWISDGDKIEPVAPEGLVEADPVDQRRVKDHT